MAQKKTALFSRLFLWPPLVVLLFYKRGCQPPVAVENLHPVHIRRQVVHRERKAGRRWRGHLPPHLAHFVNKANAAELCTVGGLQRGGAFHRVGCNKNNGAAGRTAAATGAAAAAARRRHRAYAEVAGCCR